MADKRLRTSHYASDEIMPFIINYGDPSNTDLSIKKTIKSHVMKRYRNETREAREKQKKQRKLNQTPGPSYRTVLTQLQNRCADIPNESLFSDSTRRENGLPETDITKLSDPDDIPSNMHESPPKLSNNRLEKISMVRQRGLLPVPGYHILRTTLGGSPDPFNSLCIPSSTRIFKLLQYNLSTTIRTSVHADPTLYYEKSCFDDPAWLYMMLSFSASRIEQNIKSNNCESLYFLSKTISALNDSLSVLTKQTNASTIATVACLANIENLNGSSASARIHMEGLKRIVELKGGLNNLGLEGILRRMVLWSDLLESATFYHAPIFPLQTFENLLPLSDFLPEICLDQYLASFADNLRTFGICSEVLDILFSMHQLATFLNHMESDKLPWDASYPDRVYIVEHKILTWLATHSAIGVGNTDISTILAHAALLYIYTNLRQTPVGARIRGRLCMRLKSVLENADANLATGPSTSEMLWILFLGAFAANDVVSKTWFLVNLKSKCLSRNMLTWEDISAHLNSLPVFETACLQGCKSIWENNIVA
ncbi:fungal-specific transcription factor domain-containing protein [Xylogone sp. PMI_703]|nr:fungal-specific transcription factor domain-containing protein [Xylogone sp. PMI_703]